MLNYRKEEPRALSLRSAFAAVALRARWAALGTALGAGILAGGANFLLDDNSNFCVSYQTPEGSRSVCIAASTVFDSVAENAPTAGDNAPMTGQELEDFLTRPVAPKTEAPKSEESKKDTEAPLSSAPPLYPMSPSETKPPENILTPEQQDAVSKRMEWLENPCNLNGLFQSGEKLHMSFQRPTPTCI